MVTGPFPVFRPGSQTYDEKVMDTAAANLIAYYPMNETAGTVVDNALGNSARDLTYLGSYNLANTTFTNGDNAPRIPASSAIQLHNTSLRDAWNGNVGSIMIWLKATNAAFWTDTTFKEAIRITGNNGAFIIGRKGNVSGRFEFMRRGSSTTQNHQLSGVGYTDWFCVVFHWDQPSNEQKLWINGSQVGTTLTGLQSWAGTDWTPSTSTTLAAAF